jgi:hypothetical protein
MPDAIIFEQILRRVLREELARHESNHVRGPDHRLGAFLVALDGYFGEGRFTVAGLLAIAADDPHGAIGVALAEVVDLNAGSRAQATALGRLLSRLPEVEVVGEVRGAAVYLLRT